MSFILTRTVVHLPPFTKREILKAQQWGRKMARLFEEWDRTDEMPEVSASEGAEAERE